MTEIEIEVRMLEYLAEIMEDSYHFDGGGGGGAVYDTLGFEGSPKGDFVAMEFGLIISTSLGFKRTFFLFFGGGGGGGGGAVSSSISDQPPLVFALNPQDFGSGVKNIILSVTILIKPEN